MPTNTPNINIPKPLGTETVSRSAFNAIWDLIDGLFSHVSGHDHTTRGNLIPTAALAADVGAWIDFTPTLTQGGVGVTITVRARYAIIGHIAIVQVSMAMASAGGSYHVILGNIPAAIAALSFGNNVVHPAGSFGYGRSSGTMNYSGLAFFVTPTTVGFMMDTGADWLAGIPGFSIANGDNMGVQLSYEIA